MDSVFEKEYVIPKHEDGKFQNQTNEPWQCGLLHVSQRVKALHENGNFTDITLIFNGTEISYDAHRLILAISSPVFEGILYGPMRTEGRNILLHDDDPLAIGHVIAHCYGNNLELPDMDMALEVYRLADKYFIESLKKDCWQCISKLSNNLGADSIKDVIEFVERYNLTGPIKDLFEDALVNYDNNCDNINAFTILMSLSESWIEGLISEVSVKVLDFHESWKYPGRPLEDNRLRTILSSRGCYLNKFYGCINAEMIHQFPGNYTKKRKKEPLELFLSVTDPHHAKSLIEEINQQNRFKKNLIAVHIRCEEFWPRNWSPIRPERTHRPSLLLISDADDGKASWVVEAAKAFLPQCEGSDFEFKRKCNKEMIEWKPMSSLLLLKSDFTPNGFINLLQELSNSGVKCHFIALQSPHINISDDDSERFKVFINTLENSRFNPLVRIVLKGDHLFKQPWYIKWPFIGCI